MPNECPNQKYLANKLNQIIAACGETKCQVIVLITSPVCNCTESMVLNHTNENSVLEALVGFANALEAKVREVESQAEDNEKRN